MRIVWLAALLLQVAACAPEPISKVATPRAVDANDNRTAAGSEHDGVRSIRLEIVDGDWQPERNMAPIHVLAFAEAGRAATTPGPLIRVVQGTQVKVVIDNRTDQTMWLHGLHDRPGQGEALQVPARGSATTQFRADTAGSYYYFGSPKQFPPDTREGRDSALHGALVVDAAGGRGDDRVFVIAAHGEDNQPFFWTINGRSWPYTERQVLPFGRAATWRVINATSDLHPLRGAMPTRGPSSAATARSGARRGFRQNSRSG